MSNEFWGREMQRRLIIMRHAKSDWNTNANTDHARPLNQRGRSDAPKIAKELVDRNWQPEVVISSDAQRTTETWELMAEKLAQTVQVEFQHALYHAGLEAISDAVAMIPDSVQTVMVLGHNPGWEQAVGMLSNDHQTMTTGNAALLELDCDSWAEGIAQHGAWTLQDVIRPKEL